MEINKQALNKVAEMTSDELRDMFPVGMEFLLYGNYRKVGWIERPKHGYNQHHKENIYNKRLDMVAMLNKGNVMVGKATTLGLAYFKEIGTFLPYLR